MEEQRYRDLIAGFSKARVMVVGDIYLDENVFGVMTGISLEAPIPIFEVHDRRHNPGAAGNAACNVAALGARTYMVGFVGEDANAQVVLDEFKRLGVATSGVVTAPDRPTNTYGKLRAGTFNAPSQEVLRTDTPRPTWVDGALEDAIIAQIERLGPEVDAIVVGDQVCSVATDRVLQKVVEVARKHGCWTVGDSRERAGAFKDFDVMVPNDREAGIGAGVDVADEDSLREAGRKLTEVCRNALVTRGPKGITVFAEDGSITDVPCQPVKAVDVTGAGDTVTATVAVSLVAGATLPEAAELGNAAAGVAVTQKGVVTVSADEVARNLAGGEKGPSKLLSIDELKQTVEQLRDEGKTIVWTNGCFDILHAGHITYLVKAAELGDALIVGINSDDSIKQVKGPDRPVVNENFRALVLSALECVDYLCVFSEPTPLSVIKELAPDVYAKGGDYTIDTIVQEERALMESLGGRIEIIPGLEGQSTTSIIEHILRDKS